MHGNGKVFISHAHEDTKRCIDLQAVLESWGIDSWLDREQLKAGDDLEDHLQQAIRDRDLFLRVCTAAAQRSFYVSKETRAFRGLQAADHRAGYPEKRRFINLILDADYAREPFDYGEVFIDAVARPRQEWLAQLRQALGLGDIPPGQARPWASVPVTGSEHVTHETVPSGRHADKGLKVDRDPQLDAILQEMDSALADEIAEIKQDNQRGRMAGDGRLIHEMGGHYGYTFTLSDPWEANDDTPLTLKLNDGATIPALLVTASGSVVTIATEAPLPANALEQITLVDDPVQLLERLREALRGTADGPALIGSQAFNVKPAAVGVGAPPAIFPGFAPRESQLAAIRRALGSAVSFIVGPPGTGKTVTLAAISYALVQQRLSVLIVAHTNIAVDNAILRLATMCQEGNVDALRNGKIIRYGTPQLKAVTHRDDIYPPGIAKRRGQDLDRQRKALATQRAATNERLAEITQRVEHDAAAWQSERGPLAAQATVLRTQFEELDQIEKKRFNALRAQIGDKDANLQRAYQASQVARHNLEQLVSIQSRLEDERQQFVDDMQRLTVRLAQAQRMGNVARFLQRVNLTTLVTQLTDVKQRAWSHQHALDALTPRLDHAHAECERLETDVETNRQEGERLRQEWSIPTEEGQRLHRITADLRQIEHTITTGNNEQARKSSQSDTERRSLEGTLATLQRQIAVIDEQLRDIEKRLLEDATVVATTLTKVYVDSRLREKRFDVVILDEASMAPLPAVFIALTHADTKAVVIGDPCQLPPIVHADSTMAKRWLGRDLFAVADISLADAADGDPRATLLRDQFRMHPSISRISRTYVYQDLLEDAAWKDQPAYDHVPPLEGQALVLCDTSAASPRASRPGESSRVNVYHALCAVALAQQTLDSLLRVKPDVESEFRIGIVTPYKKQAQLIQRLIKSEGIERQVRVGTIHRFQGLECEIVIFDTVESPPLPPRRGWIAGGAGSDAMRLINVAVTRAQHKLIIIANVDHLSRQFQHDDTLYQAVHEASRAARLNATDLLTTIVPTSHGADEQVHSERPVRIRRRLVDQLQVLDEETFFPRFLADVDAATQRVIIFSPFIRMPRLSQILPTLTAKVRAGVSVTVIASEALTGQQPINPAAADALTSSGIPVRTMPGLHEKLVIIDDSILYHGSLNVLSHQGTTESMLRLVSPDIVAQFTQILRLDTRSVSARWGDEIPILMFDLPDDICPLCESPMVPRRSRFGVFYACTRRICKGTHNVSAENLQGVPVLANVLCDGCKRGQMRPNTFKKELWLECAALQPCSFRRKIVVTDAHPER